MDKCLPLEGIRVVDLTVIWSGPGATMLFGDLGAEVIRVEGIHRLSRQISAKVTKEGIAAYGYASQTYPDSEPGDRPYDRSSIFNWHSRNKLSAAMCLDTAGGHEAFLRLIAKSDVFVENNSKKVLGKLGIDWDVLHETNPRLIVARMPPLGLSGSMSDYLGYGPNFNSLVGIQAMGGREGQDPTTAGDNYHMDEAAPAGLAFAVMAALWRRERTGRGELIEFPQAENVMQEIGEYFIDYQWNGRVPAILGNSDPVMFQDVLPTAEADVWVAISIRHDLDWTALSSVVGTENWLEMGRTVGDRLSNAALLKTALAKWASGHRVSHIVSSLQEVGVPASEVMSESRLLEDEHLADRQWFQWRSHPVVGTHQYPGHPWRATGFDLVWGRPVPSFGEDNEYVYKEILGYSENEFDELVRQGVAGNEQLV